MLTSAGLSREAWTRTRHAAAVDVLTRRGLSLPEAWAVATALVGHWAVECGWGRAEWGFNVSNVKPHTAWTGPVHRLSDGLLYRSYTSLADGVADSIGLAAGTGSNPAYAAPWRYLLETGDAQGWYSRLLCPPDASACPPSTGNGWHPWSGPALATYRSTYARAASIVGAPPSSSGLGFGALLLALSVGGAGFVVARRLRRRR